LNIKLVGTYKRSNHLTDTLHNSCNKMKHVAYCFEESVRFTTTVRDNVFLTSYVRGRADKLFPPLKYKDILMK